MSSSSGDSEAEADAHSGSQNSRSDHDNKTASSKAILKVRPLNEMLSTTASKASKRVASKTVVETDKSQPSKLNAARVIVKRLPADLTALLRHEGLKPDLRRTVANGTSKSVGVRKVVDRNHGRSSVSAASDSSDDVALSKCIGRNNSDIVGFVLLIVH